MRAASGNSRSKQIIAPSAPAVGGRVEFRDGETVARRERRLRPIERHVWTLAYVSASRPWRSNSMTVFRARRRRLPGT